MSVPIKPLVLANACLASSAAEAQFLGLGFGSNITLTQQDLDMIRQTVNQQIPGKPAGQTASWSNPSSQNSGTIKLLKKFTARNMRCEENRLHIADDGDGCLTGALRIGQLPATGRKLENSVSGTIESGPIGGRRSSSFLASRPADHPPDHRDVG